MMRVNIWHLIIVLYNVTYSGPYTLVVGYNDAHYYGYTFKPWEPGV